jgi:hypothetical protein
MSTHPAGPLVSTLPAPSAEVRAEALGRATRIAEGLFPHQLEGVAFLLGRRRAVLADDMGLGKTRQSIIALTEAAPRGPWLVVVPDSVKRNWAREIAAARPADRVHVVGPEQPLSNAFGGWVVVHHDVDWVPANHWQAEDRGYRIGQTNTVNVTYFAAEGTIDEFVAHALRTKAVLIEAVVEGRGEVPVDGDVFAELEALVGLSPRSWRASATRRAARTRWTGCCGRQWRRSRSGARPRKPARRATVCARYRRRRSSRSRGCWAVRLLLATG